MRPTKFSRCSDIRVFRAVIAERAVVKGVVNTLQAQRKPIVCCQRQWSARTALAAPCHNLSQFRQRHQPNEGIRVLAGGTSLWWHASQLFQLGHNAYMGGNMSCIAHAYRRKTVGGLCVSRCTYHPRKGGAVLALLKQVVPGAQQCSFDSRRHLQQRLRRTVVCV